MVRRMTIHDLALILSKAERNRVEDDPFRAFGEWDSQADSKAYAKL